jgi:hypothetical protein
MEWSRLPLTPPFSSDQHHVFSAISVRLVTEVLVLPAGATVRLALATRLPPDGASGGPAVSTTRTRADSAISNQPPRTISRDGCLAPAGSLARGFGEKPLEMRADAGSFDAVKGRAAALPQPDVDALSNRRSAAVAALPGLDHKEGGDEDGQPEEDGSESHLAAAAGRLRDDIRLRRSDGRRPDHTVHATRR